MPFVPDAEVEAPVGRFVPDAAPPQLAPGQREASGAWDALVSGVQGSASGMLARGKLPDVVLTKEHSKWYERALSGAAGLAADMPWMVEGAMAGTATGAAVGGAVGNVPGAAVGGVLGGGAGMMAVPAVIRESLVHAYQTGEADSSTDFLSRVGIVFKGLTEPEVLKATAKAGAVGALTLGAGKIAAPLGVAGVAGAEIGTMTVATAALEGHLPDAQDFVDAAIVVGGMKVAGRVAGKIAQVYEKTGIRPEQVAADARGDPVLAEELKGDGSSIPKAYSQAAEAEMLRNALPEAPKVAEVIANPRGTITDGKEPNHINYSYSEAPEDVQALRAKIAETFKTEIETARGSESWDATQERAETIIRQRLAGMSDGQKAALKGMTFSDLAAQSMAVEAMAQRAAFDARAAATEIANKGNEATPEDAARLAAAIEQSALLHAVDQGNGAEIARALNSRKAARQRGELAEGMAELLAKYGEDPHVLARMVMGLHTTAELTGFAKAASKATTFEKVIEAWKAGLLSGPLTYVRNLLGNTSFLISQPIVDTAAATWGALKGVPVGERMSMIEPLARIVGNLQGAYDMAKVGAAIFEAKGIPGILKAVAGGNQGVGKGEQYRPANTGLFGDVIRIPFNLLSSADSFFKTLVGQGEAYALATRQAAKEGLNPATREFRDRVAEVASHPDKEMQAEIDAARQRQTYQSELGASGKAFQAWVSKTPVLKFLFPFIRTPTNILKETARLTPLAPLIGEWRADLAKGGPAADKAMAELGVGTAFMGAIFVGAMKGIVTGAGDPDPAKRATAVAAGWQPYSIKVGKTYYSYQSLGPITALMGMAADAANVWNHTSDEEQDKIPKIISIAFANAVTTQTALSGLTSIVQVLSDPDRYGPRFFQQYAGSLIPAVVAQPTAMIDPLQREVNSMLDAVKARIPGLREKLLAKINPLTGEVIETKARFEAVSPITETIKSDDRVLSEAMRLGIGVAKAPKTIEMSAMGDKKLGEIKLTEEQRQLFTTASGKLAHRIMEQIVTSPRWDTMPELVQKRIFADVIKQARENGAAAALPAQQRAAKAREIAVKVTEQLGRLRAAQ